MKIYVPKHLQKIGVIKQLCALIDEYSKNYYKEEANSFDDYRYCLKLDPVRRFISLCIPEEKMNLGDQSYEEVTNYIYKMFYSVKGTTKVFEYMTKYLNLVFDGEVVYNTKYVEFSIKDLEVTDENLFYEYLEEFLDALLYFDVFYNDAKTINLVIANEIENSISFGDAVYTNTEIKIYNAS